MKKLLVLALVVVLTLSLTVVAYAATFDPYVGGRITWAYIDSDDDAKKDEHTTTKNSGIKMLLKGKINDEETGTWGAIGAQIDGWPNDRELSGPKAIYDFGINNLGGSNFNLWYTNWENENAKRGQDRLRGLDYAMYHRDPMFDHSLADAIGIDYKTDNVVINFGFVPDKKSYKNLTPAAEAALKAIDKDATLDPVQKRDAKYLITEDPASYDSGVYDKNEMIVAATFKFDGGNVHAGHYIAPSEDTETIIGAEYQLGFGTIKVDYLTAEPKTGDSTSQAQAAVFFDDLKFDVTLLMDDKYTFSKDGGMGYQIRYTGIDKVTIGYAALEAEDKVNEDKNMTDFFVGYKFGILETRIGAATLGEGKAQEKITYVSAYASFW
ncbi:MAG: hypothetical protein ACM3YE_16105 [Bacteroidota bacterium]